MVNCYVCGKPKPARFTGTVHYLKGKAVCPGCWKKFGLGGSEEGSSFADLRNAKQAEMKKPEKKLPEPKMEPKVEKKEEPKKEEPKKEEPVKEEPKPKKKEDSVSWF
jgi:hypothetical protein